MPEINSNVDTFINNFQTFDTAAKGGNPDGLVSRQDIEAVANGNQYTPEQRAAAQYLLDNPQAYAALDTAAEGGGLYTADGNISSRDIQAFRDRQPLYEDTATFVSGGSVVPEGTDRDFDDPVGAAAQTETIATSGLGGEEAATTQFMNFVEAHKDDPQWLQTYFAALGSEKTATYMSNVADPGRYTNLSADYANEQVDILSDAVQGMYDAGTLNDADVGRLVEHWALEGGPLNSGIAQMFSNMQGSGATDIQNAFARATTELALSGQDLNHSEFNFSQQATDRLADHDRESLAAAGAYVLGQTSWENQTSEMINLQADGGDAAVDRFVTLAMAHPTETPAIDAFTNEGQQARFNDPHAGMVEYDGVANIVQAMSYDTTYRGGPDRYLPNAPYSYNALQSIRDQVFYSASNGLDANRDQWQDNTQLKDGLSRIFMADFDRMVNDATTDNGARLDDDHPFPEALENFAQNVIFTSPAGSLRDQTSKFLVDKMTTIISDINTLDDAAFADKYEGSNQTQMAHIAGSILGHIDNGLEQATEVAADKYETQKKGLEFGLDLAWALGQDGLKLFPGGSVLSAILPDSITKSETFKEIKGEVERLIQEGLDEEAVELLLEKFPDLNPDDVLSGLHQELSEVISVSNERDFLSSLLSSYENVDSNPAATN